jgi:hypothetical protein
LAEPDDSPAPFAIKPLVDPSIEDVGAGVLQMMMSTPENAPTGTARILGPRRVMQDNIGPGEGNGVGQGNEGTEPGWGQG